MKSEKIITVHDIEKFLTKNGIAWFKIDVELQQVTIRIPAFRYIFRRAKVLRMLKLFAPATVNIIFKGEG